MIIDKKIIQKVLVTIVLVVLSTLIKVPLKTLLLSYDFKDINAELLSIFISRGFLICWAVYFLYSNYNYLLEFKLQNLHLLIAPVIIVLIGFNINANYFTNQPSATLSLFIGSCFSIGFAEEFCFRGILFPLLSVNTLAKFNKITVGAILSSLIFGVFHYVNLIKYPDQIEGVTLQVLIAFAIGVFFCGVLMHIKNLYFMGLLHSLIDTVFSPKFITKTTEEINAQSNQSSLFSYIFFIIIFFIILISGIKLINKRPTTL